MGKSQGNPPQANACFLSLAKPGIIGKRGLGAAAPIMAYFKDLLITAY